MKRFIYSLLILVLLIPLTVGAQLQSTEVFVHVGEEFSLTEGQTAVVENYDNDGRDFHVEYLNFDNGIFYFKFLIIEEEYNGFSSSIETDEPIALGVGDSYKAGLLLSVLGRDPNNSAVTLLLEEVFTPDWSDFSVSIGEEFNLVEDQTATVSNYDGTGRDFYVTYRDFDNDVFYFELPTIYDNLISDTYSSIYVVVELDVGESFKDGLLLSVLGHDPEYDTARLILETVDTPQVLGTPISVNDDPIVWVFVKDGDLEIDVEEASIVNGAFKVGGSVVKVLFSEVINELGLSPLSIIKLREENKRAVYEIEVEEKGKLLGFIPFMLKKKIIVDAGNGAVLEERLPWYAFLTRRQ